MLEKARYIFDTMTVEGEREKKKKKKKRRENRELI
jgi:hypothetical protein